MLGIEDLYFRYSGSEFELRIERLVIAGAETVAIVEPSGSGKTTLLNLLAGVLPVSLASGGPLKGRLAPPCHAPVRPTRRPGSTGVGQ